MRTLSSLNPLAPTAVEARGQIVDTCLNSDSSIWNMAAKVVTCQEKDEAVDLHASSSHAVEFILDELQKRSGIACTPNDALSDLYHKHLVDAVKICQSVAAMQCELVPAPSDECSFTVADFGMQVRICQKRKMESMAFVLADEIAKHVEIPDDNDDDDDETYSLFDRGVVPSRDADEMSDYVSDSFSDTASDNETIVESLEEAKEELGLDQESKQNKTRARLISETQALIESVEDVRGAVEELWGMSDKINEERNAEAQQRASECEVVLAVAESDSKRPRKN